MQDKVTEAIRALPREELERFLELALAVLYWTPEEANPEKGVWDPDKEWESEMLVAISEITPVTVFDAMQSGTQKRKGA